MRIEIPELSVVALIGASGSGKSTFANTHFKATEVLSSDYFRALVSDDETDQSVSAQAFDSLYYVAGKRLSLGRLVVTDATNVRKEDRASVLRLAKDGDCPAVAIVLDMPERLCKERNEKRSDRNFGGHVIARQITQLRRSVKGLRKEGFRHVFVIKDEEEAASVEIARVPLWCDKKSETGPFDIIGDVHGCCDELCELLAKMGYSVTPGQCAATPPEGRRAIFLGDLCDRGPENIKTLKLVMGMVRAGTALCVAGNHDAKLLKKLSGNDVKPTHGLDVTLEQIEGESAEFVSDAKRFLAGLRSHYVLDGGKLVVAHAGLRESYQGRASRRVRDFCLYGDTAGETDEYGLPVRLPWAEEYRGKALVVYGHTPTPAVEFLNNTARIDTGCVFGGKLTAYRYPEREIAQVNAKREYYAPIKPLSESASDRGDMLDAGDVLGAKHIQTRLRRSVKINAENAAAALEAMSRFAVDPRWLVYLPPTMSPCETSELPEYLEHPAEAFAYYRKRGIDRVICERKHMGSRAVIVLCRDADAAQKRFNVNDGTLGIIYTRTGRRFFDDANTETGILARLRDVLTASRFWEDFRTDWVCLDAEVMPWSAKAQKLLKEQYAPVGRAGRSGLALAEEAIRQAIEILGRRPDGAETRTEHGADLSELLTRFELRAETLSLYTNAYRRYCWDVNGLDDYRIAPFHVLAAEGKTWSGENHVRHMETISKYMTGADPIFMATDYRQIDLSDDAGIADGVNLWEELTASGGEGMVVKPHDFIAFKDTEPVQPALKCRGREYLRIIYGPEYTLPGNLERLKKRSLGRKRSLALNEFALGMEALERFAGGEPLYRVHECVFGVLALESEPVDPRL
ncbi:MAG: polynucleotide kinase-phosphatase [Clostridiales Family XIII bacterium]|jgi:protein phosphatase|nr:polynucleotide kinase-phosphatase [Clostridiales Family XIII bacterium]